MMKKEDIEDLEVPITAGCYLPSYQKNDDRCILSIQRIGNGAYDSTRETESKLDSLEWENRISRPKCRR